MSRASKRRHSSLEDLIADSQGRISKFDSEMQLEEQSNKVFSDSDFKQASCWVKNRHEQFPIKFIVGFALMRMGVHAGSHARLPVH